MYCDSAATIFRFGSGSDQLKPEWTKMVPTTPDVCPIIPLYSCSLGVGSPRRVRRRKVRHLCGGILVFSMLLIFEKTRVVFASCLKKRHDTPEAQNRLILRKQLYYRLVVQRSTQHPRVNRRDSVCISNCPIIMSSWTVSTTEISSHDFVCGQHRIFTPVDVVTSKVSVVAHDTTSSTTTFIRLQLDGGHSHVQEYETREQQPPSQLNYFRIGDCTRRSRQGNQHNHSAQKCRVQFHNIFMLLSLAPFFTRQLNYSGYG